MEDDAGSQPAGDGAGCETQARWAAFPGDAGPAPIQATPDLPRLPETAFRPALTPSRGMRNDFDPALRLC